MCCGSSGFSFLLSRRVRQAWMGEVEVVKNPNNDRMSLFVGHARGEEIIAFNPQLSAS